MTSDGCGTKRSFAQMEESSMEHSSADVYVFSERELLELKESVSRRPRFNGKGRIRSLGTTVTKAAIKISTSVVSMVSFTGDVLLSQSCGTIIETDENTNIVMTSLNLVRQPTGAEYVENQLADNLKIVVNSLNENSYVGEIVAYDFHYNLLIIKFHSKSPLQSAKLKMLDNYVGVERPVQLPAHNVQVKHGDTVVAVGRYFYSPFELMASPGCFRKYRHSEYDCEELLLSSCKITQCGDGAPIINLSGEVIGLGYYDFGCTPFLPINVAFKFWNHYKTYKELRHPSYGFQANSLYLAILPTVDMISQRFPNINGILVEKVQAGSNAEIAGLLKGDLITRCDGKPVTNFLELWGLFWDRVGQVAELEVARFHASTFVTISIMVDEASRDDLNNWPRIGCY